MMFSSIIDGDDAYAIDEVSDDDWNGMSSEDDEDDRFNQYMNERMKNPAEDFLDEMKKELNETVAKVEAKTHLTQKKSEKPAEGETSSGNSKQEPSPQKFYDPIYFDSDSDSDNEETDVKPHKREKGKHPIPTDDDLFYDPEMDDKDQKWIDDYRRSCQPGKPGKSGAAGKPKNLPNSDAILNCPACMTQLCLDCQRHVLYSTQYRAMFVQNCTVNFQQTLDYPSKSQKKNKSSKSNETTSPDIYHPVKCDVCNTEVAVYDKEEVYHFFNVIPSYT